MNQKRCTPECEVAPDPQYASAVIKDFGRVYEAVGNLVAAHEHAARTPEELLHPKQ